MPLIRSLALSLASVTAVPALALAQPTPPASLSPPPVAGEINLDQIAQRGDEQLSCAALRNQIRALGEVVQRRETAAEKVQRASVDTSVTERLAAQARARAEAQAENDKARLESKAHVPPLNISFDPQNPRTLPTPKTPDVEGLGAAYQRPASTLSPTHMRQYRLNHIAYEKGC